MSEIRLVRCPKCSKVLPEPPEYSVYQCGGCGVVLRAKKKSLVSEKLLNCGDTSDIVGSSEGEVKGTFLQEDNFDMGSRSPARSTIGGGNRSKLPMRESDLTEFDGVFPKSPMRDRFLNDLGSQSTTRESNSGDFDFDGVVKSPARSRNVSKSPVRERGSRSPMSVRTRDVSRSPLRERMTLGDSDGSNRSPARSMNGDIVKSPLRGYVVSEFHENVKKQQETEVDHLGPEEGVGREKMTPKASLNSRLSDDKQRQSNYSSSDRRRRTWRDRVDDKADRINEGSESVYGDEHGMISEGSIDDPFHGIDLSKERTHRNSRFKGDCVGEHARPRTGMDRWVTGGESNVFGHGRSSASSSTVDGPWNSRNNFIYGYDEPGHSFDSLRGPATVQDIELERAQLLWKYKELGDQLTDLDGKRFSSLGLYSGPDDYSENESLRYKKGRKQQLQSQRNMLRPSYFNHVSGPVHNMPAMYNFDSPMYDDLFPGQMKWGSHAKQPQVSKHSILGYVPGRFSDLSQDAHESYINESLSHHPACCCSLCYVNDWQGQDLPSSLSDRTSANLAVNSRSSHNINLERYGPQAYDPRMAHTSPLEQPSYLAPRHAKKVLAASSNKWLCCPIASGAPFVLCRSCFQLLKLPGKFMNKRKNQHQLQCGSSSAVMSFDLQNGSLDLSPPQKKPDSADAASGLGEVSNESGPDHHRDSFAATSTNVGSCDFDAVGHSFQSTDSEASEASRGQRLSSNLAQNTQGGLSPSPFHYSKEEHISDSASVQSSQPAQPSSSEMPFKILPPPGSPLRDHLDYSSQFHTSQAGSKRSYTEEEKRVLAKHPTPDSSVENTAVSRESEVHSNDLSSTSLSSEAAFYERGDIYVNGQHIPHRMVKKAEKVAGPIQCGEYWYDPKAGFWGVMGHHCLGIIPPSIQEFSFPMAKNCSSGDTTVHVNGRELHKRDLNLLASRGLPTKRNKSYIIDISGKVLDEKTKEFIVSLGKLAPTVERNKCGFGMQVPEELDG